MRPIDEIVPSMGGGSRIGAVRLKAIEDIFHAALDHEPRELGALLDEKCAGDQALRREVEALLASHRQAGNFIETPVGSLDASVFEDGPADPLIGQTIGHYQISKRIGRGGMGAVYLAQRADEQYEKRVAIKLIKRGMDTDAVLRHFRNERQILASLDHPNIARLLDGGTTDDGLPYFVMEYVEGLPIDEYCDRQALVDHRAAAALSPGVRRGRLRAPPRRHPSRPQAVEHPGQRRRRAEAARLRHRQDAPAGRCGESPATMIGLRVMTPEYASPEQVRGEAVTTVERRLFARRGAVPAADRTSALPPASQSPHGMARAIGETEPQRPSAVITARHRSDEADGATGEDASRTPRAVPSACGGGCAAISTTSC